MSLDMFDKDNYNPGVDFTKEYVTHHSFFTRQQEFTPKHMIYLDLSYYVFLNLTKLLSLTAILNAFIFHVGKNIFVLGTNFPSFPNFIGLRFKFGRNANKVMY